MVKPLSGALYIFAMMCIIHCGLRVLPPSSKRTEPGTLTSQAWKLLEPTDSPPLGQVL